MLFKRKPITKEERVQAVKAAVAYWNQGNYTRSREICKKYGITDEQFSKALIIIMHGEGK